MNLLIVNDLVLAASTLKAAINWNNYKIDNVFVALSAKEARNIIQNHSIDIMLCDIEMPGENGLTLIHWLRDEEYDIDCILLTCHADFSYAKEAVSLNCHEYLLLPVDYMEIANCILRTCLLREQRFKEKKLQEYGEYWFFEQNDDLHLNSPKKPKDTVDECVQYILQHISDEDLSVSVLSDHFHLNPTYLNLS